MESVEGSHGKDAKSSQTSGSRQSWTIAHADKLAQSFAQFLTPSAPKNGLITDLDVAVRAGIA